MFRSIATLIFTIESNVLPTAYENAEGVDCTKDNPPQAGEVCRLNYTALTEQCNDGTNFGYKGKKPSPCILLRLNKVRCVGGFCLFAWGFFVLFFGCFFLGFGCLRAQSFAKGISGMDLLRQFDLLPH